MKFGNRKSVSFALTATTLALVSLASGCNNTGKAAPTPANFTLAINNHFLDHADCLFSDTRFPFETTDPANSGSRKPMSHGQPTHRNPSERVGLACARTQRIRATDLIGERHAKGRRRV